MAVPLPTARRAAAGLTVATLIAALMLTGTPAGATEGGVAPGGPGDRATWTPADKDGFGTARSLDSKVWYTLNDGELTEVYFPRLDIPSVRDLQLIVSDGKTFADLESQATTQQTRLTDPRSLSYQQIDTARSGRYRITKTYATDPARSALLVDVDFQSLDGSPYQVFTLYDPSLSGAGDDDTGSSQGGALLAHDAATASALVARPAFRATSSGFLGVNDGWTDLRDDFRMHFHFGSARDGNVVQTARTALDGLPGGQRLTLSLGFGSGPATSGALSTANRSLATGFGRVAGAYADGWHRYLAGLRRPPQSARRWRGTYDVSAMVLAAAEDKTFRGGFVASPSMPWAWGTDAGLMATGAYHDVWSRDQYEIATAMLAAGDRGAADRALTWLFDVQQKPDGSFPQNSGLDGTPKFVSRQMDEVADPLILAWQLGRDGAGDFEHVRAAAEFLVANGPTSPQERWENAGPGFSPATLAAEIAGLVCAADLAARNHQPALARRWLATADDWQRNVERWTVSRNGPLSTRPYYLRITLDGDPQAATPIQISDGGPLVDQRRVVDPSFLELVRLGIKRANDPAILSTLPVVDQHLEVATPNGSFWHRFDFDGYGETRDGGPWRITDPGDDLTLGRAWPIFAGERGEYELAAGQAAPARGRLDTMARSGNQSLLLPEQVWDGRPPTGQSARFQPGEGTFSATPLIWSHAQFLRLAWSIEAGHPVEQPAVVACRYVRRCGG
jgi:glucoamylase